MAKRKQNSKHSIKEAEIYLNERLTKLNNTAKVLIKEQSKVKTMTEQYGFQGLKPLEQAHYIVLLAQCVENLTISLEEQVFWTQRMNDIVNEVE
jgi:hypothetical protein